jgi:hypothetical protein
LLQFLDHCFGRKFSLGNLPGPSFLAGGDNRVAGTPALIISKNILKYIAAAAKVYDLY